MALQHLLATVYSDLVIPQDISTLIQSWAGTVSGEFGNIKKGSRFLNSVLKEVVEEKNKELGYEGIRLEEKVEFIYIKKSIGGGSFESPIITIQNKYIRECLPETALAAKTEYSYCFLSILMISTQLIRKLVKKINTLVYERKDAPLNLFFQQAVKRREKYDDMNSLYPRGPWSWTRMNNSILPSSFRITVDKSAICPVGRCLAHFTPKELHFYEELSPWYVLQQTKAKAQNPSSCIY